MSGVIQVFLKYHHINPVRGEVLVSMRFPPGARPPTRYRTGTVISHMLTGAWRYLEHDWVARAGSRIYEPAGAARTPESCYDEDEVFFVTTGELLFFDKHGNVIARENHLTSQERYLAYCEEHGIAPSDLTEDR